MDIVINNLPGLIADAPAFGAGAVLRLALRGHNRVVDAVLVAGELVAHWEQTGLLERAGQEGQFAFGSGESYGYLAGTRVRDKDAVVASMLICEMARWYRAKGMDPVDAMEALYARCGYCRNGLISLSHPGAEGAGRMAANTAGLRAEPPAEVAGLAVEGVVDYKPGVAMPVAGGRGDAEPQALPPADVLEFRLAGGNKLLVRPSGTEPKIKAYLFAKGETRNGADGVLARLDAAARMLLG